MEIQLVDWRTGRNPRQDIKDYFESKGFLSVSKDVDHQDNVVDVYHVNIPSISIGRTIEELRERYDIMITESYFAIDTKGYKFKQR